jgi:hypothetical protein
MSSIVDYGEKISNLLDDLRKVERSIQKDIKRTGINQLA